MFLDVTDIIDYNVALLNPNDLSHSFLYLKRNDPTIGFPFDAARIAGFSYPSTLEAQPHPTTVILNPNPNPSNMTCTHDSSLHLTLPNI